MGRLPADLSHATPMNKGKFPYLFSLLMVCATFVHIHLSCMRQVGRKAPSLCMPSFKYMLIPFMNSAELTPIGIPTSVVKNR